MKILAFAASNTKKSINKALVKHAVDVFKAEFDPNVEVEFLDINDYEMPIYSIDRQVEGGMQPLAQKFYDKISDADAIIVSHPEHNGFFTAAYKNIFDWASRIDMKVFQSKPMVVMAASPGPNGGANVLKGAIESAPFFGADIKGSLRVGAFGEKFDIESGELIDETARQELRTALGGLADSLKIAA